MLLLNIVASKLCNFPVFVVMMHRLNIIDDTQRVSNCGKCFLH